MSSHLGEFYFPNRPSGTGQRYVEDLKVIAFIAAENERRFARVWQQLIAMAQGELLGGRTATGNYES